MKRSSCILIIFLFLIVGCKQSDTPTDDLITVDVTATNYPKKELILQDFMDVEYIPLETTDEFLNQGFVRAVGKDFILVTNRNRVRDGNIFVYDRKTGKALRTINRKGQGGEEYSNIIQIILDEDNNEIYVHNHYERKIQVYDLYGKFKRSLRYKENTEGKFYTDVLNYDKDHLICYDAYNEKRAFVLLSKQNGSVARKINIPVKGETKFLRQMDASGEHLATPDPYRSIMPYKGSFLLLEHSSDTVYTFLPDHSLHPFLVRTPSIHSMDPEVFLILRFFSNRYSFMETIKNEFNFSKDKGFPKAFFMYDNQEKGFFEYTVYNGDYSVKKEIYMNIIRPVDHEVESWQSLEAPDLVEAYEKGELKGKLKEIASTLGEEDNSVIMLVKHKK